MTPNRVAIIHGDRQWTYAELAARVTRRANVLSRLGVDRGDRVAVLGHNDPCHLESLFACGLLGAVLVPLHPVVDDDARTAVVRDAGCAAVLYTPALADSARRLRERTRVPVWLESSEAATERAPDGPVDRAVGLDDLCVLGFTSGTTGRSKGVMLTHGNLLFSVVNLLSAVDYLHDDVMLASAPLYRLGGIGLLLPILFKGGTCVIPRSGDPDELIALVERHRVTMIFDGPRALEAMATSAAFARSGWSSLRTCICGGSTIPASLDRRFAERGVPFRRGYGLTEAAPVVLVEPDGAPDATGDGRPPMLSTVRVVDDALSDVRPGEVGELLVRGPNVMSGYWGKPAETARAIAAGEWLRTGDAASMSTAGDVSLVGRVADAIAIDGRRIYPQWIEAVVERLDGVAECAVAQARPTAPIDVFVIVRDRASVRAEDVLGVCEALLPRRWRPEKVSFVDALPRNANGKLLRNELPR